MSEMISNYGKIESAFREKFGKCDDIKIYSAPGRVEIGGNHTDHQGGCVLAAAVNLETTVAASCAEGDVVCAFCEGYGMVSVSISELAPREDEKNTTAALIRGVASALKARGGDIFGVNMYITSDVLAGSGLSSSAAFEVAITTALSDMWGVTLTPSEVAEISGVAEREFFGKPCGLMDQMASAHGGIVAIDFGTKPAKIEKINFSLGDFGYDLAIIDVGADHADLTHEYAAIPAEMRSVAAVFGKELLSEVSKYDFYENIAKVRGEVSDRALLRALHYFEDSDRAKDEAECLKKGDFDGFLKHISDSGASSFKYLQNIYPTGEIKSQASAVALALAERLAGPHGAVRVQGGGFGGTIEVFVPTDITKDFTSEMEKVFGEGSCKILSFLNFGGRKVK